MKIFQAQKIFDKFEPLRLTSNNTFDSLEELLLFCITRDADGYLPCVAGKKKYSKGYSVVELYRIARSYFPDTRLINIIRFVRRNTDNMFIQHCVRTNQSVMRYGKLGYTPDDLIIRLEETEQYDGSRASHETFSVPIRLD